MRHPPNFLSLNVRSNAFYRESFALLGVEGDEDWNSGAKTQDEWIPCSSETGARDGTENANSVYGQLLCGVGMPDEE
ncbi:hypothetical protein MTO96_020349 [Rhipicephalus appendiculatus]